MSARSVMPLQGVRVIELGTLIAGPLTATHLANLGAEVTAIQRPAASLDTAYKPDMRKALQSGKRVLVIDLDKDSDRDTLQELLSEADILVTNFKEATLLKHGLDSAAVLASHPNLVHVWLPGFASADAELAEAPPMAWEAIIMAASGIMRDMGVNRQLGGIAASYSPLPLASAYASVWAALAACAALFRNLRQGVREGEAIEVPLASALLETLTHNSLHLESMPARYLSARVRRLAEASSSCDYHDVQGLLDPFYATYTCRDARPLYLVCPSHRHHQERAIDALGIREEVARLGVPYAQPYADSPEDAAEGFTEGGSGRSAAEGALDREGSHGRGASAVDDGDPQSDRGSGAAYHGIGAGQIGDSHAAAVRKLLRAAFLTRTAFEWEALLGDRGVPCAAHRSTAEWLMSEHALAAGLVVPDEAPSQPTDEMPSQSRVGDGRGEACGGSDAGTGAIAGADAGAGAGSGACAGARPVRPGSIVWVLEADTSPEAATPMTPPASQPSHGCARAWSPPAPAMPQSTHATHSPPHRPPPPSPHVARSALQHPQELTDQPVAPVSAPSPPPPSPRVDDGPPCPARPPCEQPTTPDSSRLPWLAGLRVLDLANVIAGPTIGATLARFGAAVDKIDPVTPTYSPDVTVVYGLAANRGKRSILLDITDETEGGGRAAFEALVQRSDILVANATSASLERLRCAPEDLEALNSELILCR